MPGWPPASNKINRRGSRERGIYGDFGLSGKAASAENMSSKQKWLLLLLLLVIAMVGQTVPAAYLLLAQALLHLGG